MAADFTKLWEVLGLTPSEVETYEFLMGQGPAAAGAVAKATRTSRGRTYQTLRSLCERGIVREEPVEPALYRAVPPADVAGLLVAESQRRTRELEALRNAAQQLVPKKRTEADDGPGPGAAVVRGRRGTLQEALRLIDGAHRRVCVAGAGLLAHRLRHRGILQALRSRAEGGVDVALVLSADGVEEIQRGSALPGVRVATLGWSRPAQLNWVVADSVALLVVPQPDDDSGSHGDDFAVRLEGDAFADAAVTWIDALVRQADRSSVDGVAASAAAEHIATSVRVATKRVEVMGPADWLGATVSHAAVHSALAHAHARGVAVRLVTEMEPNAWRIVQPMLTDLEVRVAQSLPVSAVLVDVATAFVGLPSPDGFLVRTSTDGFELRHLSDLFRRYFESAAPLS